MQDDIFVHDRHTGLTSLVSVASNGDQANGTSFAPEISAGGRYVAFFSDATNLVQNATNNASDVFVRDQAPVELERRWARVGGRQ